MVETRDEPAAPVGFAESGPQYLGLQQVTQRSYAEETQLVIDEEVTRLLREAGDRAGSLLESSREALEKVTALLLERETIDGEGVLAAVADRRRPTRSWQPRSQERFWIDTRIVSLRLIHDVRYRDVLVYTARDGLLVSRQTEPLRQDVPDAAPRWPGTG
jgi:Peptidase family M41